MKSQKINFTEKDIAALPKPDKGQGQQIYFDTGTKDGLMLIVTHGGTKTYYFYMYFQGRPIRVKIGRAGDIKLVKAREIVHTMREQATHGEDPSQKRKEDLRDVTLRYFYENVYKPEYSLVYKRAGSIRNDDSIFNFRLKDLQNRKMLSIKPEEFEKLHQRTKKELSPYTANRVLSLIKHIYSFAIRQGYIKHRDNPVIGIRKFPELSRDRFIQSDEFKRFWEALENEPNEVFKNYVLLSLFTGQRRSNVLAMRWSHVDINNGFTYFPDTKSGEPIQTPLTTHSKELLERIKSTAESDWVLPSNKSTSGHLEDPKKPWYELLKRAGIENLRLHDLRRTLASYQAITGASLQIVGKSLGHKSLSATQVYSRLVAEPVRKSMQKATDRMMEFVNL